MPDALSFDASGVAPRSPMDVIPAGWYRAWITDSEMKPTAAGTGEYLQLTWDLLDGDHKGRKVWDRLNVKNPNPKAQEIAQESLSAICHAIGVMRIQHTGQLHGKACLIRLIVKSDPTYGDKNEVKGYKAVETPKAAPAPARASQVQGAPGTGMFAKPAALNDDDSDGLPF